MKRSHKSHNPHLKKSLTTLDATSPPHAPPTARSFICCCGDGDLHGLHRYVPLSTDPTGHNPKSHGHPFPSSSMTSASAFHSLT